MSKNLKDQNFGGIWTAEKLDAVGRYLEAFTTALKNSSIQTVYIDAFAGTGVCTITNDETIYKLDGSAIRSLKISHPFSEYIFIESDTNKFTELAKLCKESSLNNKIHMRNGDANKTLTKLCSSNFLKNRRGVLFLDPFGSSVDWNTLKAISETQHLDVWYLFPLSAVTRFAANNYEKTLPDQLDRVLGTAAWREWYNQACQTFPFQHRRNV